MCIFLKNKGLCLINKIIWFTKHNRTTIGHSLKIRNHILGFNQFSTERRYTDKHEWVHANENIGTVGITNYAQESLGDIVYAQLPAVGTKLSQSDECGALESVKAASEIYAPISGIVTAINEELEDKPGLINESCYEKGWLFKLQMDNTEEFSKMMDEKSYSQFLKD